MNQPLSQPQLTRLLKELEAYQGDGTTMLTLLMPPRAATLDQFRKTVRTEMGVSVQIKSRTTRSRVQKALRMLQAKLATINSLPETGLAVFCGSPLSTGRDVLEVIVPPTPLKASVYRCDKVFYTQPLREQLVSGTPFGFAIVTGYDALFAIVRGTEHEVCGKWSCHTPKKQKKGGQSSQRYQRQRI